MNKIKNFFLSLIIIALIFSSFSLCAQNYEIVKAEKIFINKDIPLFSSKSLLLKKLGNGVKIVEEFSECGPVGKVEGKEVPLESYSNEGMNFYVYDGKAEFESIALKNHPKNFILFDKFKISESTTLTELKKYFPLAFKMYLKEKDAFLLRLKFDKKYDDEIQIMIENGKVSSVFYWTPC